MAAPTSRSRWTQLLEFLARPRRGPITLAEALPWLQPKVRPRFLYEALALEADQPRPEFRPLAGVYAVSLVVDHPDGELDVTGPDLERWGAGFEPLLQRARANLAARSSAEDFRTLGPGRYRSGWRDNLDGSRLLLPGLLRRLPLAGEPVVLLPNRDTLLVVGSEDPEGLHWALQGAMSFLDQDPAALDGCPLRLRGFRWEPFQAPGEHPYRPLLARIRHRRLLAEYTRQKQLLDRRHGREGLGITVAPFQLERLPDGPARSYTVWSPAMGEAWLPRTDQVRLSWTRNRACNLAWIAWSRLEARLGPHLEPVGLFPERYRFQAPPDPDLLEGLVC
jgi:hypothetical protein